MKLRILKIFKNIIGYLLEVNIEHGKKLITSFSIWQLEKNNLNICFDFEKKIPKKEC